MISPSPIGSEVLDDPAADPATVERIVRDLVRANRWLGAISAMESGLRQLLGDMPRGSVVTLLDVGTGAGDLPRAAVRWARQRGITLRPIGAERMRAAARVAHANGVATAVACASALPWRARSIDVVLISQTLHHFDRASAIGVIAGAATIARRGVIIADLRATRWAETGFRVAGRILRLHRATIDDGVTSLRRGYTPASLATVCRDAGMTRIRVTARPWARVVGVVEVRGEL